MLVSDIIEDAKQILGQCNTDFLLSRLTDAITTLAHEGNYDVLTGYVDLCTTSDGLFATLPRDVETPLAINIGGVPKMFQNRWSEFHNNGPGSFPKCNWYWYDRGDVPTIMDIINPSLLVGIAELKTDLNAKVRIFGYDDGDNWIRTQEPNGQWRDGFVLPLNLLSDFPSAIPIPSEFRLFPRNFSTEIITDLQSNVPHDLTTGAAVVVTTAVAPLPTPLTEGGTYFVRTLDTDSIQLYATGSDALIGSNPIAITSANASSSTRITDTRVIAVKTQFNSSPAAHNIQTGQAIQFTATTMPIPLSGLLTYYARVLDSMTFTAHATPEDAQNGVNFIDVSTPGSSLKVRALQQMQPITFLQFALNHNFVQGDTVTVSNSGGSLPSPLLQGVTYYVRVLNAMQITLHTNLSDATTGDNPVILTTQGTGTNTVIKSMLASVALGSSSNITAINHNLNVGDFCQFTTTGTFPTPITQGTVYEHGNPSSANTFTLNTTVPAAVNITGLGAGQLFLIISRPFTIGFFNTWKTDATNLSTGAQVLADTTGAFPSTTPALDATTVRYVRKDNDGTIELFESAATALDAAVRTTTFRSRTSNVAQLTFSAPHGFAAGDIVDVIGVGNSTYNANRVSVSPTGLTSTAFRYTNAGADEGSTADTAGSAIYSNIKVNSLGAGTTFLVLQRTITTQVRSSVLNISSSAYLKDGATIRLLTTDTLPNPLAVGTDYKVSIRTDGVQLQTTGGADIALINIGSGIHNLTIVRDFTVEIPTSFVLENNDYSDGDAVVFDAGDQAPAGLVNGTTYYIRRLGDNEIELYDTAAHAINTSGVVGRVTATSTGSGVQTLLQTLPAFTLKKVERVLKDVTDGFTELYAWDTGRQNNVTILGRYFPDETQPSYRRIRLGTPCTTNKWIRMRYKRKMFKLNSLEDYIPMTSKMAILMSLKSLEYYRKEAFDRAASLGQTADMFLKKEQKGRTTPGGIDIQFNSPTFTNGEDSMD